MQEETNTKLKKYLLGSLNEQETEDISLQIISDPSFEGKLMAAENDLMEDFLEKNLSADEEKLFSANFLVCSDRVDELRELSLLKRFAASHIQTESIPEKTSAGLAEQIKSFFSTNFRPVTVVLALLIVCLLIGLTWRVFFSGSSNALTPLEREYAELNQKDLSNPAESANFNNVVLTAGTLRDTGASKKLKAENLTEKIFFRLVLPFEINNSDFLKAELVKEQKTIFTQNQVRLHKNQNGQEVMLILPKSVLQKGNYQIRLENPNAKDSPIIFNFTVE